MDATFDVSVKVDPQILKKLRVKSDFRGWVQTLSHLGAIAVCTWLLVISWGSWWMIPVFMAQGILINCLYAGVHEFSHSTVFRTPWLNTFFSRIFTFILLMGRDQDKFEHFQHHRYTQDIEKDAEIAGAKPFTLTTYLLYFFGITYWPYRIGEVIRLALGQTGRWPHLSAPQFKVVHREARIMVALYALIAVVSVALGSWAAVKFWLLPMFAMKWFHNMENIAEHTGMPHETDILTNTRTLKAGPVMRWLLWNMPYHMAHHTYPMIPFHQLPKLQAEIASQLDEAPPSMTHMGFQYHMIRKLICDGHSRYAGRDLAEY